MDKQKKEKIIEKSRMKIAITNLEEENIKMTKNKVLKMVATFVLAIGITTGLVYASSVVYEKIWKEPKSYTLDVTDDEKEKCISEEEARNIGNSYLKKIGCNEENIKGLELTKEVTKNNTIWEMWSEKVTLTIDGNTGNIKSVSIPSWSYEILPENGITRVEARKTAKELLEKYRPENDKGEYELVTLRRNNEKDEDAYIWYAEFYKKYGNLLNKAERIYIGWIPTINGLYCLEINNNPYENNEQVISKEEAIQIAIDKDKQIEKNKTIKNTLAEIKIEQMNEKVYLRENYKEEYESGKMNLEKTDDNVYKLKDDAVFYETDGRVRKVWRVIIEYDTTNTTNISVFNKYFTYYVDATTAEIIGGEENPLWAEENNKNDPNNVIEK